MSQQSSEISEPNYRQWLQEVKSRIARKRVSLAVTVNRELIRFYFELGMMITSKQEQSDWGDNVISKLSHDLRNEFPNIKGFSVSNLKYCKQFYRFYTFGQRSVGQIDVIGQRCVDQIPWGHNIQIFSKCETMDEASFYVQKTRENGWSRDVLALQIKSDLFSRQGSAITNFKDTLPPPQSDLAQQTIKDPYTFDFLSMTEPYNERDVERQLITHITKFLLELGKGFAFIGQQYPLEIQDNDYYLDLLFYHTTLKCYVVVELKNTKFMPEYVGKLNFYLSAMDTLVKRDDDNPTIGLLLCRDKDNIEVEFSLRDMQKPMGVSQYTVTETLPDNLKGSLPSPEEIEAEIAGEQYTFTDSSNRPADDHVREEGETYRSSYFRPEIDAMDGYTPGEQIQGQRIIKLNTNENPYPPSPAVKDVLESLDIASLCRYPDPMSCGVRDAVGDVFGLDRDWVIAGNGSDDILTILLRSFCDANNGVACLNPGYSLYPVLANIQGAPVTMVELTEDFSFPADILEQIAGCNLFFLTRPNAPTGLSEPMGEVIRICREFDGIVCIDEAYADFAESHCVDLVRDFENVIVTRTVSKSYSLANIRLGLGLAQPHLIEGMMKVKDSYNVNGLTQLIGEAALRDQDHLVETATKLVTTRERVRDALIAMGFDAPKTDANFLFVKPPCDAATLFSDLKAAGILVRYFSSPRCKDYLRISIGSDDEMNDFLKTCKKLITSAGTAGG